MDIVGRCDSLTDDDIPSEDQYKFYLAFENSNCDYYITEKFFNPIRRADIIPVVMGASKEAYNLYGPQVHQAAQSTLHVVFCRDPSSMWMTTLALSSWASTSSIWMEMTRLTMSTLNGEEQVANFLSSNL